MKNKSKLIIIISIILLGCKTDDFYDTERILLTNKTEYEIGENFELTLKISTKELKKEIRVYENYKNLEISFSLANENENIQNEDWSKNITELSTETKINEINIGNGKPFQKIFTGKISEIKDEIELNIEELNLNAKFPKEKLKNGTKIRIHGFCNPINPEFGASLEEFFEVVEIKIKMD